MTKPNEVRPDKAVGRDATADLLFVAIAATLAGFILEVVLVLAVF